MELAKGIATFVGISVSAGLVMYEGVTANVQAAQSTAQTTTARDPGVRGGVPGAGSPLSSLTADQIQYYLDGQSRFMQTDAVGGVNNGLGPAFNSDSCGGCHAQPATGGSSPSTNPQIAAASAAGASNTIPFFISASSPVREARFPFLLNANGTLSSIPDGGVHDLFTIEGRSDAPGCVDPPPNFEQMNALGNLIFRIPTPVFGAGLIENIAEATILANEAANVALKQSLGISGHANTNGNDGTITRYGWKAQNKSIEIFAGEAYNVEMGVTNELFPNERGNAPASCLFNPTPEDSTNFASSGVAIPSDIVAFSDFMRFLAAPSPSVVGIPGNPSPQSVAIGQATFNQIHCTACHTPSLETAASSFTPGLSNQTAALYSDLLVHHMGSGLADNITQGSAGPDEFRTAPLWGLGQRLFFLHDGRATPFQWWLAHGDRRPFRTRLRGQQRDHALQRTNQPATTRPAKFPAIPLVGIAVEPVWFRVAPISPAPSLRRSSRSRMEPEVVLSATIARALPISH